MFVLSLGIAIGSIVETVFLIILSINISGAFPVNAKSAEKTAKAVFITLLVKRMANILKKSVWTPKG